MSDDFVPPDYELVCTQTHVNKGEMFECNHKDCLDDRAVISVTNRDTDRTPYTSVCAEGVYSKNQTQRQFYIYLSPLLC